jgi:hypothetical protein
MFEFKGDLDNLEGKVTILARVISTYFYDNEHDRILFLYATRDAKAFMNIVGAKEHELPNYTEATDVDKPLYEDEGEISEFDIAHYDGDTINLGDFFDDDQAYKNMEIAKRLYFGLFNQQNKESEPVIEPIPRLRISDFSGKSIKDYLRRNYLAPYIESFESGGFTKADVLASGFMDFFDNGNLSSQAFDLIQSTRAAERHKRRGLAEAYLSMIDCAHQERYEEAAKYRERIKKGSQ